MRHDKKWYWNEFRHVGTDYASREEVAAYNSRMRQFRDIDAENERFVSILNLPANASVLEIGAGTASFSRHIAKSCRDVTAIDISPMMLDYAESRAKEENLKNITFANAGFLSFDNQGKLYDAAITGLALHHLPDTWKAVALRNIHSWLKPKGTLLLLDVVFQWHENEQPEEYFERITPRAPGSVDQFERHIAQEYSTLAWIMEGLLERAGFEIENDICENEFLHCYLCRKR